MKVKFDNYTMCGELCDGQHFVPIDTDYPYIKWFGFYNMGHSLDTTETFHQLSSAGLDFVDNEIVFNVGDSLEKFNEVMLSCRCKKNEGAVIRVRNIKTGFILQGKVKSVEYIVKRFLRSKLLGRNSYRNI